MLILRNALPAAFGPSFRALRSAARNVATRANAPTFAGFPPPRHGGTVPLRARSSREMSDEAVVERIQEIARRQNVGSREGEEYLSSEVESLRTEGADVGPLATEALLGAIASRAAHVSDRVHEALNNCVSFDVKLSRETISELNGYYTRVATRDPATATFGLRLMWGQLCKAEGGPTVNEMKTLWRGFVLAQDFDASLGALLEWRKLGGTVNPANWLEMLNISDTRR
eukprot:Hpha_TRINITY_DN17547_c0_g1::TRINITY_DN17547_c0_g1_i1::g.92568::m.92568